MSHASPPRLHALDATRAGALLLGVVLHATMSFFPTDFIWMISDTSRSAAMSASFFVIHMFRMALFFLLAGFFARMVINRIGTARFIASRAKRIALPFILFWPAMMIAFTALVIWAIISTYGALPEGGETPAMSWQTIPLTHLWFLYVLLIFSAAAVVLRPLGKLLEAVPAWTGLVDGAVRALLATPLAAVILAIPVAAAMTLAPPPMIPVWFGVPSPDHGLIPNTPSLVSYGLAFGLGWVMHRQIGLFDRLKAQAPIYLIAAIGLTVYCLSVVGLSPDLTLKLETNAHWLFSAAYAVGAWCWIFGLAGLAQSVFSGENRVIRYVSDASYWIYLIHLPLIVALQIWVAKWALPAEIKIVIILAIAMAIMLASYHWLVRGTFMGWMLNGRRRRKTKSREQSATLEMQT